MIWRLYRVLTTFLVIVSTSSLSALGVGVEQEILTQMIEDATRNTRNFVAVDSVWNGGASRLTADVTASTMSTGAISDSFSVGYRIFELTRSVPHDRYSTEVASLTKNIAINFISLIEFAHAEEQLADLRELSEALKSHPEHFDPGVIYEVESILGAWSERRTSCLRYLEFRLGYPPVLMDPKQVSFPWDETVRVPEEDVVVDLAINSSDRIDRVKAQIDNARAAQRALYGESVDVGAFLTGSASEVMDSRGSVQMGIRVSAAFRLFGLLNGSVTVSKNVINGSTNVSMRLSYSESKWDNTPESRLMADLEQISYSVAEQGRNLIGRILSQKAWISYLLAVKANEDSVSGGQVSLNDQILLELLKAKQNLNLISAVAELNRLIIDLLDCTGQLETWIRNGSSDCRGTLELNL